VTAIWVVIAVLVALAIAEAVAIVALAREIGLISSRLPRVPALEAGDGPAIGQALPAFAATSLDGRQITAFGGPAGRFKVLIFLSSGCSSCRSLAAELGGAELDWPHHEFCPIISGDDSVLASALRNSRFRGEIYQDQGQAMRTCGIHATPSALVVGEEGTVVGRGIVNSREMISSLLDGDIRVNHEIIGSSADGMATG
jgi:hypothetical protein